MSDDEAGPWWPWSKRPTNAEIVEEAIAGLRDDLRHLQEPTDD